MTTLEQFDQAPNSPQDSSVGETPRGTGLFNEPISHIAQRSLLRLTVNRKTWEIAFYVVVLVIAVLTRFVGLGDRVMSHDESLHTKYSEELYRSGIFSHTPLMHGPVLFHMTALSYFLFGDSDFTARLYPAILGIIMVLMPVLLFERWLGKRGAMMTSLLILISPMLLYHHRYIREDTPAIFFTILMAYAIFAYLDGVRPRQTWHLVLFSAATLLNLASKETAFAYIGLFGFIVTLFLVIQLVQAWKLRVIGPSVGWAVVGLITIPISAVIATIVVSRLREQLAGDPAAVAAGTGATLSSTLPTALIAVPVGLVICLILFFVVRILWGILSRPATAVLDGVAYEGNSLFKLILAGIIMGTVFALMMTVVLSIIKPESIQAARDSWAVYDQQAAALQPDQQPPAPPLSPRPETLQFRWATWTGFGVLILMAILLLTAVHRFSRLPKLPWRDITIIILVAAIFGAVLIIAEERARSVPNVSAEVRGAPLVYENVWVEGSWVLGILGIAGVLYLRLRTRFFEQMQQFPAFDLALVLGSLVIPWLSAIPLFLAGYQLDANVYSTELIQAMAIGTVPFALFSVVLGACWNAGVWVVCAGTFYSLFAFFYTTIFTNAAGIGTGLVGSLGYWLVQQGVNRGSQPQYYYLLLELPVYEYLPMIGAALAGIVGLSGLWAWRARQAGEYLALQAADVERAGADASPMRDVTAAGEPLDDSEAAVVEEVLAEEYADSQAVNLTGDSEAQVEETINYDAIILPSERLTAIPFMGFVGYWAVLIIMALTMAGEKMPWLTTHLTLPLILASGWYLGRVLESVDWRAFLTRGWALVLLIPLFVLGAANVIGPVIFGQGVFSGLERDQLFATFTWLGAIMLTGLIGWVIWQIIRPAALQVVTPSTELPVESDSDADGQPLSERQFHTVPLTPLQRLQLADWRLLGGMAVLALFLMLGVLTARTAWNAAYINYDYATEFMVYAHGAPANKTIIAYLEDISRRTTDGMYIKVAYDNQMSWPGSWYFRDFPNARYIGDTTGANDLDQFVAIAVGTENAQKIEPQLGDNYFKFDLPRLWWPMQDYFNLNLTRIDNALGSPAWRQALWDIWLNRDYKKYGELNGNPNAYDLNQWPVIDRMVFYVRKDVASQVWNFGVGASTVASVLPADAFANLRCDTCAATAIFDTASLGLNAPRGIGTDGDGNVYVADSRNGRIVIFNAAGSFLREISTKIDPDPSLPPGPGMFSEPWSVAVAADGTVYVADTWYHRILMFAADGSFSKQWGFYEQAGLGVPSGPYGFYGPRDIKLDAQGNVYVADTGNKRVRVYDRDGNFLRDIGVIAIAGNMKEPVGIAINNEMQEIYIASTWSKKIEVYSLLGDYRREWTLRAWTATTEQTDSGNRPFLALDSTGRFLFVTDPDVARILVYEASNGSPVLQFGRLGTASTYTNNQFGVLGGIAFEPTSGSLLLTDAGSGRVLRFDIASLPGLNTAMVPPISVTAAPVTTEPVATEAVQDVTAEGIPGANPEATVESTAEVTG